MTYDTLELLLQIHYWALFELYAFAAIVYASKKWIDYQFEKRKAKKWKE
tara:strand:+ start:99 stop:245 length:147 start_codon:yes stop_codon:yes gene_type:complete